MGGNQNKTMIAGKTHASEESASYVLVTREIDILFF